MSGGGGGTMSAQTVTVTPTTTPTDINLGFKTTTLMFRAKSDNATDILIKLGTYAILGGNLLLRAGETISVDITNILMLRLMMLQSLNEDDFITKINYTATGAGANTLYIDALSL